MGGELQSSIAALCGSLANVLHHAESSSRALADAASQRPIHLESSTSSFLRKLDGMAEEAGAELQHLESMTLGAVSFAELLGHCGEALKVYARHADAIEARLVSFGYVPPVAEPEVDAEEDKVGSSSVLTLSSTSRFDDDDAQFEESVSIKNLGLSEASLAALSAEDFSESPAKRYKKAESTDDDHKFMSEVEIIPPKDTNGQDNILEGSIRATKEEYEQLPPYMKSLTSWEDLKAAIPKLNSYFSSEKTQGSVALNQDDIGKVGLGHKDLTCCSCFV